MKTKITFVMALSLITITSFARIKVPNSRGSSGFDAGKIGIAPAVVFNHYFGGLQESTYGLNLRFTYDESNKNTFAFGYVYNFPNSYSMDVQAVALSSQTMPPYITVPYTYSFTFHEIYVQASRHFVGDNDDNFSLYGFLGASLVIAATSTTYGEHAGYQAGPSTDNSSVYYEGFTINGGLGTQFKVGPGYIYGEGRFAYPANTVQGKIVENPIPASVGLTVGYKIRFGR